MRNVLLALLVSLFTATASASCEPRQVSGLWNVTAVNGNISTAGFARFFPNGTVAVDAVGSAFGSDPSGVNIPRATYVLDWIPVHAVFAGGLCQVTATYVHDGITEKYWLVYPAGTLPNTLRGGDAVTGEEINQTLQVTLTRRVERSGNN
jgi:hypothetical protein